MVNSPNESAEEFLEQLKDAADAMQAIYPDNRVQIQLLPVTYGFCRLELHTKNKKMFDNYEIFLNPALKGRYAIAVLEEVEPGFNRPSPFKLTEEDDEYFDHLVKYHELPQQIFPNDLELEDE